ncbi:MAG: GNAT family N-acetyltransferase [Actinomycetota bacterium]|nr:GNAT family N-acetyltransferase [Actinomycetota bacterium]
MIALRTVDAAVREQVLGLAPAPRQARFSGVAADTLPAAERHRTRQAVAILRDEQPVGFFALDHADAICAYTSPERSVALRAFFVDARVQRQGIASAALRALPAFTTRQYRQAQSVVLTVNVVNPVAVRFYRRAGFVDTGRVHLGGTFGPQHVLVLPL